MMKLPRTIDEAIQSLEGIAGLLTAKEWHRAAIVYAFTNDGKPGPKGDRGDSTANYSCREFAEFGITGLKSDATVRTYRKAWQAAIDNGVARPVEPGDEIHEPDMDWPPTDSRTGNFEERIKTQVRNADPKVRSAVFSDLVGDPDVVEAAPDEQIEQLDSVVSDAVNKRKTTKPSPEPTELTSGMIATRVEKELARAGRSVDAARELLDEAFTAGVTFDDTEIRGLVGLVDQLVEARLAAYRKTVGMLQTEEVSA